VKSQKMSKQIRTLSELMVVVGLAETQRKAKAVIKKGDVYLDDIRCANTDLHLVLIHPCILSVRSTNKLTTTIDAVMLDIQQEGIDVTGNHN